MNNPIRYPANAAGEHLLDAITRAGGPKGQGFDTWVMLERNGKQATVPCGSLVYEPSNNIWVHPNDTVHVYREPQTFVAFGATGQQGQFNFDAWRISVAEAVGKAGGLSDALADPGAIFLYRGERREIAAMMGVDVSRFTTPIVPTVYNFNMRDPSTYFLWTLTWGALALLGAYSLNPTCALIFVTGCLAEAIYCKMLKVSYLRTLVSGGVKTAGAIAAVFAVSPDPSALFLLVLFLWLFFWEIGGQNVPNDWSDLEEDKSLGAETIPVRLGSEGSAVIIMVTLAVANVLSLFIYWANPAPLHPIYLVGAAGGGTHLLLLPAFRLYASRSAGDAALLFNRSSYYPLTMLTTVLISSYLSG